MSRFAKLPPKSADEFLEQAGVSALATTQSTTMAPVVSESKPAQGSRAGDDETGVYKSITVRLTKQRYKSLKLLSTISEETIQDIATKALDEFLAKRRD